MLILGERGKKRRATKSQDDTREGASTPQESDTDEDGRRSSAPMKRQKINKEAPEKRGKRGVAKRPREETERATDKNVADPPGNSAAVMTATEMAKTNTNLQGRRKRRRREGETTPTDRNTDSNS